MKHTKLQAEKSKKIGMTDKDIAEHLLELLRREIKNSPNCGAIFRAFANANPAVQKRIVAAMRDPKRPGRPRRKLPDDIWLMQIEGTKRQLQAEAAARGSTKRITDRAAIVHNLQNDFMRFGRQEDIPFKLNSESGFEEVRRVVDAIARARRAQKLK